MSLYRNRYRIESTRLKGWDYAVDGWYFVTICTQGRECFFGKIVDRRMRFSKAGIIALRYWEDLPNHIANAGLDAFVIMPNHLHGIVIIKASDGPNTDNPRRDVAGRRDVACNVSTMPTTTAGVAGDLGTTGGSGGVIVSPKRGSLGAIVRSYKSAVTKWCRMNGYTSFAWQPRFYDHIVRDDTSLQNIRRYIRDNPAKWELDRNNPEKRVYGAQR